MAIVDPLKSGCPLLGWLAESLERRSRQVRTERQSDSPYPADVFLTLHRLSDACSDDTKRVDHNYLRQAVVNDARSTVRREFGRRICRNCTHYASSKRACTHPGNSYQAGIAGGSDPRKLTPPCEQYAPRRRMKSLSDRLETPSEDDSVAERVWLALEELHIVEPKMHALLVELYIEGRTRVDLARHWGVHRKTVEKHERRALGLMKRLLEDLP